MTPCFKNRDSMLRWITECCGPIGPDTFAGFGSDVMGERARNATSFEAALEDHEKRIRNWTQNADFESEMPLLLDILEHPPGPEFQDHFYERFRDEFDFQVNEFIGSLGKRDPKRTLILLASLFANNELRPRLFEILPDLESDAVYSWLKSFLTGELALTPAEFMALHDVFLTCPASDETSAVLNQILALVPDDWDEIREQLESLSKVD